MQLHVISPIKCANLSLMLAHHPFLTSSASKCRIALGNISSCVGICGFGFGSARNVCQCRLPLPSSLLPLNPPCDVPRRVRLHCDYLSNLASTLFPPSLCLYMQSSRGGENEIKESEETGGVVEELVAARNRDPTKRNRQKPTFHLTSMLYLHSTNDILVHV